MVEHLLCTRFVSSGSRRTLTRASKMTVWLLESLNLSPRQTCHPTLPTTLGRTQPLPMDFFSDDSETEEDEAGATLAAATTAPVSAAAALDEAEAAEKEEEEVVEKEGEEEEEEEPSCENCGGQSSVRVVAGELKCMACAPKEQPQDEVDDLDGEGGPPRSGRGSSGKRLDTDGLGYTRGEFIEFYGEQVPLLTLNLSLHLGPSLHPSRKPTPQPQTYTQPPPHPQP